LRRTEGGAHFAITTWRPKKMRLFGIVTHYMIISVKYEHAREIGTYTYEGYEGSKARRYT
jgi:hypothetical protein